VIFHYGEERWSRRIAAAIVWSRRQARIETTGQLVEIISRAVPKRFYPKRIHVATRTFQALRIAVNDELTNLQRALQEAPAFLKPGARMCVISFHSLEDRFVKQHFRDDLRYQVVTRKPVVPAEEELQRNPRARSAKLRAAAIVAGRNI
jgi:16S rRNA (cytosine1402-N4)-methyltransferase